MRVLTTKPTEALSARFHLEKHPGDGALPIFSQIGTGFVTLNLPPKNRHRRAGLLLTHARFAPPHDGDPRDVVLVEPRAPRQHGGFHHYRNPHVRRCADGLTEKLRRRHANNRQHGAFGGLLCAVINVESRRASVAGAGTNLDFLSQYVGRAAESAFPKRVADHRDRTRFRSAVILRLKSSSERRAHAERLKIGAGDQLAHTLIGGLAGHADRQLRKRVRSKNPREYIVDVSQPFVTRIGELAWKNDQFLRTSHRQQPQHHLINEAENRCVRPDAERKCEHGHGGEAGILQQLAESEFEIIHNATPPSDRSARLVGLE